MLKCIACGKIYDYEATDGICPKCGAYNSGSGTFGEAQNKMRTTEQYEKDNSDIFSEGKNPTMHHHGKPVFDELDPRCIAEESNHSTYTSAGYAGPKQQNQYVPQGQQPPYRQADRSSQDRKNNKAGIFIAIIILYFIVRAIAGLF